MFKFATIGALRKTAAVTGGGVHPIDETDSHYYPYFIFGDLLRYRKQQRPTMTTAPPPVPEAATVDQSSISAYERLLRVTIAVMPTIFLLQPVIGGVLASLLLWTRAVLIPLLVVLRMPRSVHGLSANLFLILLLGTAYEGLIKNPDDFVRVFLAIIGSVVLYRAGTLAAQRWVNGERWGMLVHGTSIVNLTTILIVAALGIGKLDLVVIFNAYQKDIDSGLTRFALGNAIEVPFVVCALLFAGLRHAPNGRRYLGAATLNLITAGISESRLVVIVAVLIFIDQWLRSPRWARLLSMVALAMAVVATWELVEPVLDSIIERFSGNDAGSANDRAFLYSTVLDAITPLTLLVGGGLTSAAELIRTVDGSYRTVEATWLQLQYEIGVLGLLLMGLAMHVHLGIPRDRVARPDAITIFFWLQLMLFLPVNMMMPPAFFAMGALMLRPPQDGT